MFRWGILFQHFREMSRYFIAATLVFAAGIWLGYSNFEQFDAMLQGQMDGMRQLAEELRTKENVMLWLFAFIFFNNTVKAIFVVFAGIAFGVLPLFFLVINGMILGYLAQLQEQGIGTFFIGIVPHGILEIPAILIACAYGLRLGTLVLKAIAGLFYPPMRSTVTDQFKRILRLTLPLIGFLVVTLLIAAIIETTITPWLLMRV